MPFIRAIRTTLVDDDVNDATTQGGQLPNTAEHVTDVLHSVTTTGPTTATSVVTIHRRILSGERFRTFDEHNHHQADVVAQTDQNGRRVLSTRVAGRTSDHLWRLPRF